MCLIIYTDSEWWRVTEKHSSLYRVLSFSVSLSPPLSLPNREKKKPGKLFVKLYKRSDSIPIHTHSFLFTLFNSFILLLEKWCCLNVRTHVKPFSQSILHGKFYVDGARKKYRINILQSFNKYSIKTLHIGKMRRDACMNRVQYNRHDESEKWTRWREMFPSEVFFFSVFIVEISWLYLRPFICWIIEIKSILVISCSVRFSNSPSSDSNLIEIISIAFVE